MPNTGFKVFVSYSRKDVDSVQKELIRFLKTLEDEGIVIWWDEKLERGERWNTEIKEKLNHANAAVLFITENFITSEYITETELPIVFARYENSNIKIFPLFYSDAPTGAINIHIPIQNSTQTKLITLNEFAGYASPNKPFYGREKADQTAIIEKLLNDIRDASNSQKDTPVNGDGNANISREFNLKSIIPKLDKGDHLIVAARTCVTWFDEEPCRLILDAIVDRRVSFTFIMQDSFHHFALGGDEYKKIVADWHLALDRFRELKKSLGSEKTNSANWFTGENIYCRSLLTLKLCPDKIINSRVWCFKQDASTGCNRKFNWVRYDLGMKFGLKPFSIIQDEARARPILEETILWMERSVDLPENTSTGVIDNVESLLRNKVRSQPDENIFDSKIRGIRPDRLVRQAYRTLISTPWSKNSLPAPLSVQILLTQTCVTKCVMCNCHESRKSSSKRGARRRLLSRSDVIKLLDNIAEMGTRSVIFSGGEPLMFDGIESILKHCREKSIKLGILTSGIFDTREDVDRHNKIINAIAESCSWIQISIDSFTDDGYLRIRRSDRFGLGSCIKFIEELLKSGMRAQKIEICCTIQKENIKELKDAGRLLVNITERIPKGIPVRFKFATGKKFPSDGTHRNSFLLNSKDLDELERNWDEREATLNAEFDEAIRSDHEKKSNARYIVGQIKRKKAAILSGYPEGIVYDSLPDNVCSIMKFIAFVDAYGDVYPCCYLFNDNSKIFEHRRNYLVGSWKQKSGNAMKEIWESEKFAEFRRTPLKQHPREACGRCTRHMQQNVFLTKLLEEMRELSPERLDRAVQVYEDPSDPSFTPIWL